MVTYKEACEIVLREESQWEYWNSRPGHKLVVDYDDGKLDVCNLDPNSSWWVFLRGWDDENNAETGGRYAEKHGFEEKTPMVSRETGEITYFTDEEYMSLPEVVEGLNNMICG